MKIFKRKYEQYNSLMISHLVFDKKLYEFETTLD